MIYVIGLLIAVTVVLLMDNNNLKNENKCMKESVDRLTHEWGASLARVKALEKENKGMMKELRR